MSYLVTRQTMQEYWGMLIGEIRHVCTVQIHDTLGLCSDQTTAINAYFVLQHIYIFNSMNNVLHHYISLE